MEAPALKALVEKITAAVQGGKNEDAVKLLKELQGAQPPSEDALRATKAGAAINKLKKSTHAEVAQLADKVVQKWKEAVEAGKKRKRGAEEGGAAGNGVGPGEGTGKRVKAEGSAANGERAVKKERADGKASTSSHASPAPSDKPPAQHRKLSTISADRVAPREAKTDNPAGLKPRFKDGVAPTEQEEKIRGRGVVMCYDALCFDSTADNEIIVERAVAIEEAIYLKCGSSVDDKYRAKNRELFLSLKEKSNAALRDSIVTGRTGATELVNFDKEALASETLKAERAQLEAENMFAAQSAGATDAETDAFKCGKCGQRKTRYYQMQTRSADEPMTTFVTCTNCGNRWKFS